MEKIDLSQYQYEVRDYGTFSHVSLAEYLMYQLAEKLNEVIDYLNKKEGNK